MITCQYAQTAGVDRKAFVKTEFSTEVGNQVFFCINVLANTGWHGLRMVGVIGRKHPLVIFHENAVIGSRLKPFLRDPP